MVFIYNRIPIVSWLRGQAAESLAHADKSDVLITYFGGHSSLSIDPLLKTYNQDIGDILRDSLAHEAAALHSYKALLKLVEGDSVMLEEYAPEMIYQ